MHHRHKGDLIDIAESSFQGVIGMEIGQSFGVTSAEPNVISPLPSPTSRFSVSAVTLLQPLGLNRTRKVSGQILHPV